MNKKAVLFNIAMSVITLIILTSTFLVLDKKQNSVTELIGERQYDLINNYNVGERYLFFLDEVGKLALVDAVYDLAGEGGFDGRGFCGQYRDYNLLNSQKYGFDGCSPPIEESLGSHLLRSINDYIESYNSLRLNIEEIPLNNYYFDVRGNTEVYGQPISNIIIGADIKRNIKTPKKMAVDSFYKYEIEWSGDLKVYKPWPLRDGKTDFSALEQFFTSGNKIIYADPFYETKDTKAYDMIHYPWTITGKKITPEQIDRSEHHYGYPTSIDKLDKIKLVTKDTDGNAKCEMSLDYEDDLPVWQMGQDRNLDGFSDKDCKDSPSWVQCPGIRVYYCGKYGKDSFPERNILHWSLVDESDNNEDVNDFDNVVEHYVWVNEYDNDGLSVRNLHSKTSAKFYVDISADYILKAKSNISDENYKTEGENIVGEEPAYSRYAIKPAFYAKIDYDIHGEYDKIINEAKIYEDEVLKCEALGNELSFCVGEKLPSNWQVFDDSLIQIYEQNKVYWEVYEKIKLCTELGKDVLCEINVESPGADKIIFTPLEDYTKIETAFFITSVERFIDKPIKVAKFNKEAVLEEFDTKEIELQRGDSLYLLIKNGEIAIVEDLEILNLYKPTEVPNRKYKFQVKYGSSVFPANEELVYKFAMTFRSLFPPPPIPDLVVNPLKMAENSFWFEWSPLENEKEIGSYDIIHFENPNLKEKKTPEILAQSNYISLEEKDVKILRSVVDLCKFFKVSGENKCYYGIDDTYSSVYELEKNKLYYNKDRRKYMVLMDGVSVSSFFGVVARNHQGYSIDNDVNFEDDKIVFIGPISPKDNMPPGKVDFVAGEIDSGILTFDNIVVSENILNDIEYKDDAKSLYVYGQKYTLNLQSTNPSENEGNLAQTELIRLNSPQGNEFVGFKNSIEIDVSQLINKDGSYYFSIVAQDREGNPGMSQGSVEPPFNFYPKLFGELHNITIQNGQVQTDEIIVPNYEEPNLIFPAAVCSGICLPSCPDIDGCEQIEGEDCFDQGMVCCDSVCGEEEVVPIIRGIVKYENVNAAMNALDFTQLFSDAEFTKTDKITSQEIQAYLDSKNSFLKESIDGVLFSDEIVRIARENGINPLFIMARAQVERSALTKTAEDATERDYAYLLGCGATDQGDRPEFAGVTNQIQCSIDVHKNRFIEGQGKTYPFNFKNLNYWNGKEFSCPACDGECNKGQLKELDIKNAATYALYMYTPHQIDYCIADMNTPAGGNYLVYNVYVRLLYEMRGEIELYVEYVEEEEIEEIEMGEYYPGAKTVFEYTNDIELQTELSDNHGDVVNVPSYIILHHTATNDLYTALRVWKTTGNSAQYLVGRDGSIVLVVDENKQAWHAGCGGISPGEECVEGMNSKSIGIEIVNCGAGVDDTCGQADATPGIDPYPLIQREAVNELVMYLIEKYNIVDGNIWGHGCVRSGKMMDEPSGFEPPDGATWNIIRQGEDDRCASRN